MASDYSKVSSKALIELKTDLTHLSESLHGIYDLMNADMSQVGEYWEDPKYAEFVSGYQPQIAKCEEISERYNEWCKRVLDPTIEKVIAIETTDVGGDGGSSVGGGVSSGVSDGAPASSGGGKFDGFNMGGGNHGKAERCREATQAIKDGKFGEYHESPQEMDPAILKKWYDDHTERGAREREYPHEGIIEEWEEKQREIEMRKRENMFNYLMGKDVSR